MMRSTSSSLLFLLLALALTRAAAAHEGHDHAETPAAAALAAEPRLDSTGTAFELVGVARGHVLTLYVDRVETNEPVADAAIEISTDGKPPLTAKAVGSGTYEAEATWLDEPGAKPLVFVITAGEDADLLNGVLTVPDPAAQAGDDDHGLAEHLAEPLTWLLIGGGVVLGLLLSVLFRPRRLATPTAVLLVGVGLVCATPPPAHAHEGHDHGGDAPAASALTTASPRREPDGSIFVPKPTQRLLEVRTTAARIGEAQRTIEVIGTVVADPSAFGRVQAPMDGLVELGGDGLPYVGRKVEAGEVLARLTPTIPLADLGTMQQLRAEVAGKLKVAEQKLSRLNRIASVVAQSDIEDTRAEIEALREQGRVLEAKDVQKFDLVAPVSGTIAVANVGAGQVVSARDTLFEIVDPGQLWVEAAGTDTHGEDDITGGIAHDADGHTLALAYIGRAPTLRQQSQSLLFRLTEQHTGLAVGAPVTVVVERGETDRGIILPEEAVVRGSHGLPLVFVKTAPERFRPALVTTRPLDSARVLVTAGIGEGDRVVTHSAELINQIR